MKLEFMDHALERLTTLQETVKTQRLLLDILEIMIIGIKEDIAFEKKLRRKWKHDK